MEIKSFCIHAFLVVILSTCLTEGSPLASPEPKGCSAAPTTGEESSSWPDIIRSLAEKPIGVIEDIYAKITGWGKQPRQQAPRESDGRQYAILMDAGSSGTRVGIYTWTSSCADVGHLLNITALTDPVDGQQVGKKIKPGLSSRANDPDSATSYIEVLLDFAAAHIPPEKQAETPLYILATAGMRLLTQEQQDAIYNNLLTNIPKKYQFKLGPHHIETITGKEEGVYSWVSINYLSHKLDRVDKVTGKREPTIGMIEMGGASAQIAFEITSEEHMDEIVKKSGAKAAKDLQEYLYHLYLGTTTPNEAGKTYLLYSRTFLGLGADAARRTYLSTLILGSDAYADLVSGSDLKKLTVSDPCLPPGSQSTAQFLDADGKPIQVDLQGIGSFQECNVILQSLVDSENPCHPADTTCPLKELKETGVGFEDHDFDGLGQLYYSLTDLIKKEGSFNYEKVAGQVEGECNGSARRKRQSSLAVSADEKISTLTCFKSAWTLTFLHQELLMPSTYTHFNTLDQIDGISADYPLGALLVKSLSLPRNCPQSAPVSNC